MRHKICCIVVAILMMVTTVTAYADKNTSGDTTPEYVVDSESSSEIETPPEPGQDEPVYSSPDNSEYSFEDNYEIVLEPDYGDAVYVPTPDQKPSGGNQSSSNSGTSNSGTSNSGTSKPSSSTTSKPSSSTVSKPDSKPENSTASKPDSKPENSTASKPDSKPENSASSTVDSQLEESELESEHSVEKEQDTRLVFITNDFVIDSTNQHLLPLVSIYESDFSVTDVYGKELLDKLGSPGEADDASQEDTQKDIQTDESLENPYVDESKTEQP